MSDKMREEFEKAFAAELGTDPEVTRVILERGSNGQYRGTHVCGAWWGWQASRAALVVELPEAEYFHTERGDYALPIEATRKAIKAAGVKVKP